MEDIDKFMQLVESSQRILITSHISPDPDAISSVLLLGTTLGQNYPNKQIGMALEEEPQGLDFLSGYKDIKFGLLAEKVSGFKPIFLSCLTPLITSAAVAPAVNRLGNI